MYFHIGYVGLSPPLLLFFCFCINESLLWLSTLGYVNKLMVGRGMHIVGLHSAEKMGDKDSHLHSLSIFFILIRYNQPSHLLSNFTSTLHSIDRSIVHIYKGFRGERMHRGMLLTFSVSIFTALFHVWAHLLKTVTEVQVNGAWDLSSVHND